MRVGGVLRSLTTPLISSPPPAEDIYTFWGAAMFGAECRQICVIIKKRIYLLCVTRPGNSCTPCFMVIRYCNYPFVAKMAAVKELCCGCSSATSPFNGGPTLKRPNLHNIWSVYNNLHLKPDVVQGGSQSHKFFSSSALKAVVSFKPSHLCVTWLKLEERNPEGSN